MVAVEPGDISPFGSESRASCLASNPKGLTLTVGNNVLRSKLRRCELVRFPSIGHPSPQAHQHVLADCQGLRVFTETLFLMSNSHVCV
jgi:hypothetical protein